MAVPDIFSVFFQLKVIFVIPNGNVYMISFLGIKELSISKSKSMIQLV